jgi:hypothetical protein
MIVERLGDFLSVCRRDSGIGRVLGVLGFVVGKDELAASPVSTVRQACQESVQDIGRSCHDSLTALRRREKGEMAKVLTAKYTMRKWKASFMVGRGCYMVLMGGK